MNIRDKTILDWTKEKRSDVFPTLREIIGHSGYAVDASPQSQAMLLLLLIGFESGRRFQAQNPKAPLDDARVYVDAKEGR